MTSFAFYNVNTSITSAITSTQTIITLSGASGLPASIPSGDTVVLGITSASGPQVYEIIYATAISGNTITVLHAKHDATHGEP